MLLDQALLDKVSAEAKEAPRLRMNFNLHESLDSKVLRLFNAMEPGTIVPIQRFVFLFEVYACCWFVYI